MNCPRCGKLFNKMSDPLCSDCMKDEERQFADVRKFLEDNPNSTITDVVEATGVAQKKILKYIRDGRLEATSNFGASVTCEKCGRPIKMGRYCDKCIIEINQGVEQLFKAAKDEGPKMHSSHTDKGKR